MKIFACLIFGFLAACGVAPIKHKTSKINYQTAPEYEDKPFNNDFDEDEDLDNRKKKAVDSSISDSEIE